MIDLLFYDRIKRAFKTHKFYANPLRWVDTGVKVTLTGESIEITFNAFKITLLRKELSDIVQKSMLGLELKNQEMADLTRQMQALEQTINGKSTKKPNPFNLFSTKSRSTYQSSEHEMPTYKGYGNSSTSEG